MHGEGDAFSPDQRRKVRKILAALVVPLALLTLIVMAVVWPRGETIIGTIPVYSEGSVRTQGTITSIGELNDSGLTPVTMAIESDSSGEDVDVPVQVPYDIIQNGLQVGDKIWATFTPSQLGSASPYIFSDFVRTVPLAALGLLYLLSVLVVARGKGLMAILGLAASLAVVGFFVLPALAAGSSPAVVVLVGASAMMFASIYLAHGVSIRTTTALLGTFGGLLITLALAVWAVGSLKLTGTTDDDALIVMSRIPGISMSSILLCGMLLAGLGALNDVTITQVSTVWELHGANPRATRRRLFARAMVVGRDHIASTVYTLAFAYVGTALPMLMAASLMDRSFSDFLQVNQIAEEIARTLTASIGLILAIPVTTAVAAMLAPVAPTVATRRSLAVENAGKATIEESTSNEEIG